MTHESVSVLMPVYNTEPRQLRVAVESVFAQKFTKATGAPYEIVVVDDGSTNPATRAQVQALADERHPNICVHFHEKNKRKGAAMNTGLRAAKFDTILPLDPDDILLPPTSSKSKMGLMEQGFRDLHTRSNLDIFSCNYAMFGVATGSPKQVAYSPRRLLYRNMLPNYSMYLGETALDAGGYNEKVPASEDWLFYLSMLRHRQQQGQVLRVKQTSEILYGYRQHSDGRNLTAKYNRTSRDYYERAVAHVPEVYKTAFPNIPLPIMPAFLDHRLRLSYYWGRVNDIRNADHPLDEIGGIVARKFAPKTKGPQAAVG